MDKLFQIGSFYFQVTTRENLLIPENFLLFQSFEKVDPDFTYNFSFTESILPANGRILAKRQDLTVYETPFGEGRLIGRKGEQDRPLPGERCGVLWEGKRKRPDHSQVNRAAAGRDVLRHDPGIHPSDRQQHFLRQPGAGPGAASVPLHGRAGGESSGQEDQPSGDGGGQDCQPDGRAGFFRAGFRGQRLSGAGRAGREHQSDGRPAAENAGRSAELQRKPAEGEPSPDGTGAPPERFYQQCLP